MALTYRVPSSDEFEAFLTPVWRGFGFPAYADSDEAIDERLLWEPTRSLGALDGDEWVGGTGAFSFELTVPGGKRVPMAGVTMVGVAGTHRRRGVLTELMRRQLDDVAAAGESVAGLNASEGRIYGRFGYGVATHGLRLRVDTRRAELRPEVLPRPDTGRLRSLTVAEAAAVVPAVHDRWGRDTAGSLSRSPRWWQATQWADRETGRGGKGALFVVVHTDAEGGADGYALYRVRRGRDGQLPGSQVIVSELLGASDEVEARLWRFLLDADLMSGLEAEHVPEDSLLPLLLADPRQVLTVGREDFLWLRVVDVVTFLTARRYGAAGSVVLDVVDEFRPASAARVRLEVDADGAAEVTPTDAAADVLLGADALGALALGGTAASSLARVGRVTASSPAALASADALFRAARPPSCTTMF